MWILTVERGRAPRGAGCGCAFLARPSALRLNPDLDPEQSWVGGIFYVGTPLNGHAPLVCPELLGVRYSKKKPEQLARGAVLKKNLGILGGKPARGHSYVGVAPHFALGPGAGATVRIGLRGGISKYTHDLVQFPVEAGLQPLGGVEH